MTKEVEPSVKDDELVREAFRMCEQQFGMKYPAAEMAFDRILQQLQEAEERARQGAAAIGLLMELERCRMILNNTKGDR